MRSLIRYTIIITTLFFFINLNLNAQACNCVDTVKAGVYDIDGDDYNYLPGDTICIEADNKPRLYVDDFYGDSSNYVTFINLGGQVIISDTTTHWGIRIQDCQYFRFTGTGDTNHLYGFVIDTTVLASGVSISNNCTDVEIDHFEIKNVGGSGIKCKKDPSCSGEFNRGNFEMKNLNFHHNYISNTDDAGFYVGFTHYTGIVENCNGQQDTLYPHDIRGAQIHNNIIMHTGREGIQISCVVENCEIYNNNISDYGFDNTPYQTNGIQLGGGVIGSCFNNTISNGAGTGIICLGQGYDTIYNNIIINPGITFWDSSYTSYAYGIYCDDKSTIPGAGIYFINNTIINPIDEGIKFRSTESIGNIAINNLIVKENLALIDTSDFIDTDYGAELQMIANQFFNNIDSVKFIDHLNGDYRLNNGSAAINSGSDYFNSEIIFDADDNNRKFGYSTDVGAYEYKPYNNWQIDSSNYFHTFIIDSTLSYSDTNNTINEGDYLGLFSYFQNTLNCLGYAKIGESDTLKAFKQNPNSNEINLGYEPIWKIWDSYSGKENYIIPEFNSLFPDSMFFKFNGISKIDKIHQSVKMTQTLSFENKWNLFSVSQICFIQNLDSLFSTIENIEIIKDNDGNIFWPKYGINMIEHFDIENSYYAFADTISQIDITGVKVIPEIRSVAINENWNQLPFLPDSQMQIQYALSSINSNIVMLKDEDGLVYWPLFGINAIGLMHPGKGYLLKSSANTNLFYPSN